MSALPYCLTLGAAGPDREVSTNPSAPAIMACVADFITHGTLGVSPVLQTDVRKLAEVAGVFPAAASSVR